jgi:hypothetical protein
MRTEKQAIKVTGEQANVEICGGGETVDQRRDGVQDKHRCGARSVQCVVIAKTWYTHRPYKRTRAQLVNLV